MDSRRFLPRQLDFESLVGVLVQEHRLMEAGLGRMKEAAGRGDFAEVSACMRDLDPVFRQHIADEESQILRLLIGSLGSKGAEDEIRVFQQHRPIYKLMQLVSELASKSSSELAEDQQKLNELFLEHTYSEEQGVFPKALRTYRGSQGSRAPGPP